MAIVNIHSRADMTTWQHQQLNKLLQQLAATNAFYRDKILQAGEKLPYSSLQQFFSTFPFTRKDELVDDQAQTPPYGRNLTYPLDR